MHGQADTTTVSFGTGYREWNVTSQVRTSYQNGVDRGFLIRDAGENADAEQQFDSRDAGGNRPQHSGNQQSFHSTEKAPDSPPQLVVTFG